MICRKAARTPSRLRAMRGPIPADFTFDRKAADER
jgi:hypothetical protein